MSEDIKAGTSAEVVTETPTPVAPVTPPAPTPSEDASMKAVQDKILAGIMGKPNVPAAEEPKKEEPKKAESTAADDKPVEKPPASDAPVVPEPQKRVKKKAAPAPVTPSDIAKVAAEAAVKAVNDSKPAPVSVPTPAEEPELAPQFAKEADLYKHLARTDPNFKGLIGQLNTYAKTFDEYRKSWKAEHPGEKFDPESSDHDSFYEENEPKVSDRDLARAAGELGAQKVREEHVEETKKRDQEAHVQRLVDTAATVATKARESVAAALLSAIGGETAKGGLDENVVKEIIQIPGAKEVLQQQIQRWAPVVEAAGYLHLPDGHLFFDKGNPVHREVARASVILEDEMASDQTEDGQGRTFVTREQYAKMSAANRETHYTINGDMMVNFFNRLASESALEEHKNYVKSIEENAAKLGFKKESAVQSAVKTAPNGAVQSPAPATASPVVAAPSSQSVASPTGGPTVVSGAAGQQTEKSGYDYLFDGVMGRGR